MEQTLSRGRGKKKLRLDWGKMAFAGLFCILPFLIYLLFCVYPIIQSVVDSFTNWKGYVKKDWIGFDNYVEVFTDPVFWKAIGNDFIITGIKEVIIIFLTILFAVSLTRFRLKTGEVITYKFIYYIPNVLSTVIIGSLWSFVFMSGDAGLLNAFLGLFKGQTVDWLTEMPLLCIGFVASWCGVGLFMLTMISSINQIPADLYEAAEVDGASSWQQLIHITMPAVWLEVTFMVVSILYQSLGGNFAIVNVFLPNGGVDNNAMVMGLYVYLYGAGTSRSRVAFSYAAAIVMLFFTATVSLGVKTLMNAFGRKFYE
ncbi:MAG: sugar ABC transporter permease [bacterium]|nr:sugar ABC transporter permease [bacterium]